MQSPDWTITNKHTGRSFELGRWPSLEDAQRAADQSGLFRGGLVLTARSGSNYLGDTTWRGRRFLAQSGLTERLPTELVKLCLPWVLAALSVAVVWAVFLAVERDLGFTVEMSARDQRLEDCTLLFALWTAGLTWGYMGARYSASARLLCALGVFGGVIAAGFVCLVTMAVAHTTVPLTMFGAMAMSWGGLLFTRRMVR